MTKKTKYELMTELKELCRVNKINKSISTMLYKELEHEIEVIKDMMSRSQKVREQRGPKGPRVIRLVENEEGIKVAVKPEKHLTKPEIKRPVGRPRKDTYKFPESSDDEDDKRKVSFPPTVPAHRHETLGADSDSSDSDDDSNKIVHIPPTSASRCTCMSCPVHNSKGRY